METITPQNFFEFCKSINDFYDRTVIAPAREYQEWKKSYDSTVKNLTENKGGGY